VGLFQSGADALGQVEGEPVLAQATAGGADVDATVAGVERHVDRRELQAEQRQSG
jgi:hypothetical protein